MNKKLILFWGALMVLMCLPGLLRAQETLTVYDGTASSNKVPVYGYYGDAYLKCEFVIPASELSAMNGGTISQMTFYPANHASGAWTGSFQVFLKEVPSASISDFSGSTDAAVVYIGTLNGTGNTMTVDFTNTYQYNGGNLLVGVYQHTPGNYYSASFYGENVGDASVQGYVYENLDDVEPTQQNFIPKTTFTYTGGGSTPEWNFGDTMSYCGENADRDGMFGGPIIDFYAVKYPASLMAGRNYLRSVFFNLPARNDISIFTLRICQEEVNGEPQTSASIFEQTYSYSEISPGWVELPTPGCELDDTKPLWVIFGISTMSFVETNIHERNAQLVHSSTGWTAVSDIPDDDWMRNNMWAFYAVTNATEPVYTDCSGVLDLPFTCGFENNDNLDCWTFLDTDGDGQGWTQFMGNQDNAHSGTGAYYSASWNFGILTPDNWMITPKLHIPSNGATITWWDYADERVDYEEHYSLLVSTTGTQTGGFTGNIFETTLTEGETWTQRSASLANYAGQDVHLAFRHYYCTDQNRLLIDDISVTAGGNLGIDDNSQLSTFNSQLKVYPNPASDVVTVISDALCEVSILDLNGRVLSTVNTPRVSLSGLASGVYFLRIVTTDGVAMRKLIVEN